MDTEKAQTSSGGERPPSPETYSVFTRAEKRCITAMVAYSAAFSTLSSFIYFPALTQLAESLSVSIDAINLTITSYMAVATVAPTLLGDAADILGRRPACVFSLSLYVVTNLAMALSKSYVALLVLRLFQAFAISGIFAVAYGVVTDIATPAERGSYVAAVSFASTIAPSLGPVLGGGLAHAAGWPWIFWFLCISASLSLVLILLFLPETSRNIVGNGSARPPRHLRLPPIGRHLIRHWKDHADDDSSSSNSQPSSRTMPNPLRSLRILARRDNAVVMLACGLLYAVYTCVCASLSVLFVDLYALDQLQAGLVYLPFGLGGTASTAICGPLLNRAYRRVRDGCVAGGREAEVALDRHVADDLDVFPVERARLGVVWLPMAVATVSVVAFGWTVHLHMHIAIPLCLQFILGLAMQLSFSIYNTLLVDKNHRTPAAAQASSNIVRCALAAIVVAFLQNIIVALGVGWTFTLMGGWCVLIMALFFLDYHKGMAWRTASKRLF
ncbi:hypothetical protein MCOR25_005296 [Pyricularia grisea]|uniref:Major facilitator superfamily (MFS) profile domain-containing protein n=1 Tax=Pyricularia grisea TaxID=148305 RepID=A0A6P8AWN5_PYRGI|nr:uncharacterized protein PgNI_08373 [Pyricularia grisea]KAI6365687.1 hypothetical protein MCOR25_005296 [Pyricularia grisea]TLD06597.1 hypothetical protein PgNI_08373 [Pyricularia grisea]